MARSPEERKPNQERSKPRPTRADVRDYLKRQNKPYDKAALLEESKLVDTKTEEGAVADTDSTETPASMPDPAPPQPNTKVDIPAWMPDDPSLWFRLVEDCFAMQREREGKTTPMPDRDKLVSIVTKLPGNIVRLHQAHYVTRNYEAFKNAVCGVAIKTDASLFRDFMGTKLADGMPPSAFVQKLLVIIGNLADNSKCRAPRAILTCDKKVCGRDCGSGSLMAGKEHILLSWLLKNALETQLPAHMAAVLSSVPFDIDDYLNQADSLYANHQAKTTAGAASVETCVAALSNAGADQHMIDAIKQAGKNRRRDSNNNRPRDNTQSQSKQPKRCRPHQLYGLQAWNCHKGDCPDRNKPLAERPKNTKKKGESAGVDSATSD